MTAHSPCGSRPRANTGSRRQANSRGWRALLLAAVYVLPLVLLVGCVGTVIPAERAARDELAAVADRFRPDEAKPGLPTLTPSSGLGDYLRFAILNSPRVEAAYQEWAASIERITTARSLPDLRLTFQVDIADMIMSTMAGLMVELPGPGKRRAAGGVAAEASRVRYHAFEMEVLRTAFAVKRVYYRLQFLEDDLRLQREMFSLLGAFEVQAQQQQAAGRASLQDVLRVQIEQEWLRNRITDLEDSRGTLVAELKAVLGLEAGAAAPPVPAAFTPSEAPLDQAEILELAARRNPRIRQLAAEVGRAQAQLELARQARVPDFNAGLEVDFKANPVMWSPMAGLTLPIWRDKTAAGIAGAQAETRAAAARLSQAEIELAAELAGLLYQYRTSARAMDLLEARLLPKGRQALEAARAGYANAQSGFADVIAGYRQLLDFERTFLEARTSRELTLASLSLLIAGTPPPGSPLPPADGPSGSDSSTKSAP
ncbi:MAG: TolC family protein [Lentisphaerae bacterium]|nr:TolC family protein [Lentisphaerota bacterium]